jgi:hypothetical protein
VLDFSIELGDIEQEIECPRCFDVMTLSSDFDKSCNEIDLAYIIVKASEIVSFQVARDLLPTSLA